MADGLHHVRLERTMNQLAWDAAHRVGERKDRWLSQLLIEWGQDFVPPPPPPPKVDTRDLVEIRVFVEDATWKQISARARHEGRDVSSVLAELVQDSSRNPVKEEDA